MVDARVDLPEPLGPMMAWVSPVRTVRLTPFRISLVPCSVSMLTCRSLISRVDMCLVLLCPVPCGAERFVLEVSKVGFRQVRLAGVGSFGAGEDVADIHVNVVALNGYRENRHRIVGRQLERLSAAEIELGAVAPAFDRAAFNLAVGQ